MTPCSTLEQRWSACRNAYQPWIRWAAGLDTCLVWWGPPQRDISHRRPCTSPRRKQCRAGTESLIQSCRGEHPDPWNRSRMYVPIVGGRWDWFNAVLPGD